jgi:Flp pilus assembly protein TadG
MSGKRGAALVEFALTLPLLALLLFAIIQYGFIFGTSMTLRHGAHETARAMSLAGQTSTNVSAIACNAISPLLNCANLQSVQIDQNATVSASGDSVSVNLTYNLDLIIPWVVPNSSGGVLPLQAQAVYRKN